jgi:hypothetical protein
MEMILASTERREEQTAAVYLNFGPPPSTVVDRPTRRVNNPTDTQDSLYNIDDVVRTIQTRISLDQPISSENSDLGANVNSRVSLDALAKVCMMKGCLDDALKYFLVIGALHSSMTLQDVEESALSAIAEGDTLSSRKKQTQYAFVIYLIEKHHLHEYILDAKFLPPGLGMTPLFALAKLVGLHLLGEFLISHCVASQGNQNGKKTSPLPSRPARSGDKNEKKERRGTLPLDLVAGQLEASPKLLHWYLHLVFVQKPELYIIFPFTAIPPPIITSLHRKHLDLHIKYAGVKRDSAKVLEGVENYRATDCSTPLLSFLKVSNRVSNCGISRCFYRCLTLSHILSSDLLREYCYWVELAL